MVSETDWSQITSHLEGYVHCVWNRGNDQKMNWIEENGS